MKNMYLAASAAIALFATTAPASAAQYFFDFTTSTPLIGPSVSGSGVFTTSDTAMTVGGETAFSILSITGSVNGSAITAPVTGTSYGNYFTTGAGFLDGSGIRFFTASGLDVRFFLQSSGSPRQYRVNTFGSRGSSNFVSATSTPAVPEPGTWAMMIMGFALLGAALRHSRKKAQVSFAF